MSLTSDAKEVYASATQNKGKCNQTIKLFYCDAHDELNHSFGMYVRANTHDEAAKRLVEYLLGDGLASLDDIDEHLIEVFEVPSAEGMLGVVEWHTIDFKSVPKEGLL